MCHFACTAAEIDGAAAPNETWQAGLDGRDLHTPPAKCTGTVFCLFCFLPKPLQCHVFNGFSPVSSSAQVTCDVCVTSVLSTTSRKYGHWQIYLDRCGHQGAILTVFPEVHAECFWTSASSTRDRPPIFGPKHMTRNIKIPN